MPEETTLFGDIPQPLKEEWEKNIVRSNFYKKNMEYFNKKDRADSLLILIQSIESLNNDIKINSLALTKEMRKFIYDKIVVEISNQTRSNYYDLANHLNYKFITLAKQQYYTRKADNIERQKFDEKEKNDFLSHIKYSEYQPYLFFRTYRKSITGVALIAMSVSWHRINELLSRSDNNDLIVNFYKHAIGLCILLASAGIGYFNNGINTKTPDRSRTKAEEMANKLIKIDDDIERESRINGYPK
jgi:hypothetical protein